MKLPSGKTLVARRLDCQMKPVDKKLHFSYFTYFTSTTPSTSPSPKQDEQHHTRLSSPSSSTCCQLPSFIASWSSPLDANTGSWLQGHGLQTAQQPPQDLKGGELGRQHRWTPQSHRRQRPPRGKGIAEKCALQIPRGFTTFVVNKQASLPTSYSRHQEVAWVWP